MPNTFLQVHSRHVGRGHSSVAEHILSIWKISTLLSSISKQEWGKQFGEWKKSVIKRSMVPWRQPLENSQWANGLETQQHFPPLPRIEQVCTPVFCLFQLTRSYKRRDGWASAACQNYGTSHGEMWTSPISSTICTEKVQMSFYIHYSLPVVKCEAAHIMLVVLFFTQCNTHTNKQKQNPNCMDRTRVTQSVGEELLW